MNDRLSDTLLALADPTRRAILARLATGAATVNELAEPFDMTVQAVSKHIKMLERGGLIIRTREAQSRPCQIQAGALKDVADWLDRYRKLWDERLDRLGDYLKELQEAGQGEEQMNARIDPVIPAELRNVTIVRTFDAPRDLVWKVWTDPEHLKAWWGPHGFDAPHPTVDLRVGGKMNLDMRAPDGTILHNPTTIKEVKPPEKLVIHSVAFADEQGNTQLEIEQAFTFTEAKGKTSLTIQARVITATAALLPALQGMRQGWNESLEKIEEHLALSRWLAGAKPSGAAETLFAVPAGEPVVVSRASFHAPREIVWDALTEPALRDQWWGPEQHANDVSEMDVRNGGKWRIDQRDKDGNVYPFSGAYSYVMKPTRYVGTFRFGDEPEATETVTIDERNGHAILTNVTRFKTLAQRDAWAKVGMEKGARQSMERLASLVGRVKLGVEANRAHEEFATNQKKGGASRKVTHAMFKIERTFDAPRELVFNAFADPKAKARWFGGPADWIQKEKSMDFRVGGREVEVGGPVGGPMSRFDARYYDIVPNERLVYAYEMYLDDARISVSVATIEFQPAGNGTQFVLTEQGAYLDGFDNPALREEGTRQLVEALARSLKQSAAA